MKAKRLAKVAMWVITVPLALVVVALLLVWVGAANGVLRQVAIDSTEQALDASLAIGRVSGSPFGTLTLHDAVLSSSDGERLVRLEEADVELAFAELLSGQVGVDVRAQGLDVFLRLDENGDLNILSIVPPGEEESSGDLPISLDLRFDVGAGTVVWRDDSAPADDDALESVGPDFEPGDVAERATNVEAPAQIRRAAPHTVALTELSGAVRLVVEKNLTVRLGADPLSAKVASSGLTANRALDIEGLVLLFEPSGTLRASLNRLSLAGWTEGKTLAVVLPPEDLSRIELGLGQLFVSKELIVAAIPELDAQSSVSVSLDASPNAQDQTRLQGRVDVTPTKGDAARLEFAGNVANWTSPGPETSWELWLNAPDLKPAELAGIASIVGGGSVFAYVDGKGIDPATLTASARVGLRRVDVDAYRLESFYAAASIANGKVTVDEAWAHTPYASAATAGEFDQSTGAFDWSANVVATDAVAQVADRLLGQKLDVRADLEAKATGRLDLAEADPLAMVKELEASAEWTVAKLAVEDVVVTDSRGRFTAGVGESTDGRRTVRYDVRASANGVRTPSVRLQSAKLKANGSSRLEVGEIDTMAMLKRLETRIDADVRGLVAGSNQIRRVNVVASLRPEGNTSRYSVQASAAQTRAADLRIDDAALDLRGNLGLGAELAWPGALRSVSARGQLAGQGLRLGTDKAGTLQVDIDVAGPLADLGGKVDVNATDFAVADYNFKTIDATVAFTGDREFRITADATQAERAPEQVDILARGRYTRDLTDFTVLELEFTTSGETWNLSDGFSFDTKGGRARFDDVTLEHGDQRIHIDGYFEQGKGQDLRAEVNSVQLQTIVKEFGLTGLDDLQATVNAEVEMAGTAAEPTSSFRLHITELFWAEYGPFEVLLEGRYGERRLVVERLEVDGYDIRLLEGNADAPIRLTTTGEFEVLQRESIDLYLETPTFELIRLEPLVPPLGKWRVEGTAGMTTKLRGSLADPSLDIEVEVEDVASQGPEGSSGVQLGPVNARVASRYTSPKTAEGGLQASLNAAWGDEPPIQAFARVKADVAEWLRESLIGQEVDWVERLEESEWRLRAKAQQFDLRNLRVGAMREADVEGKLSLDISADGKLANPRSQISIDLNDFGWERYRDVFLDANATVGRDRVSVEDTLLRWDGDDILRASGSIPAPFAALFGDGEVGDLPLDAAIELQPLPIAKFSAIDYTFAALSGELTGYVKVGGTLKSPEFAGRFAATDLEFSDKSRGSFTTEVSLSREQLAQAQVIFCRGPKEVLLGNFQMPLPLDLVALAGGSEPDLSGEVSASLKGENVKLGGLVPRKVLDDYISDVGGRLSVDMAMTGTLDVPKFDGRLRVKDGTIFLAPFSRGFVDMQLDVAATDDGQVRLHDFLVREDRGFISASGETRLEGWQPTSVDATAEVQNFGTAGFTDLNMFVSARADVSGDVAGSSATAKANISDVEVVIADAIDESTHATTLDDDIVVIRKKTDREDVFDWTLDDDDEAPITISLDVQVERGSWIRHPQAQVEVMADLQVELSAGGITLGGEAQTVRGSAEVLGKRFEIEKGLVTFTGADPPDPRLQIEAAYALDRSITRDVGQPTSGDPRAIVRVTGSAYDPRIRFLSDPEMPESDVIYVLLTNRPPGQAGVGETEAGGLAAGAASGLASGLIQEKLGKVLPVDVLRVEAGDSFTDPRFEVGKYVRKNVFVSLEYQVAAEENENDYEINVEYRFLPRWVLVVEGGNLGTGDLNVFWDLY